MIMFFLQALFFIAVAFGLGCLFGCWLKGKMGHAAHHSGAAAAVTHEGAARTVTAGELAASRPHYEPETSPQPAASLASTPEADAKAAGPATSAPVAAPPVAVKKATGTKTRKPAAAKPAAAKTAAGSSAAKPRAAKAAKPVATAKAAKPAAAKPKAEKAKPAAAAVPDNLKQIKGIGPAIEAKLNAIGVNSFAQIAAWTKKEQADFAEQLSFAGRIEREEWVSQAKVLAKGGVTEFAGRVARGEVASSADAKPKRGGKT